MVEGRTLSTQRRGRGMLPLVVAALVAMATPSIAAERPAEGSEGAPAAAAHAHANRRGGKQFLLPESDGAQITLWRPDLKTQPLTAEHDLIKIPSTGMDNYHAIVAAKDWGDLKETVIRYEYLFGKPSGHSPRELLAAPKAELEIVPDPQPREHWRYQAGQGWGFQLLFRGNPLAGQPVALVTEHGSRIEAATDQAGRVRFHLPDDFPAIEEGRRDLRSAEFAVRARYSSDGITHQTLLSARYHANPRHWQSFDLGLVVMGLGMVVGGWLGRVRPKS